MTPSRRLRIGATLAALSLVAACGLRTPVRPPEDTAPVIPGTPTVTREADATVVRWRRAVRSADDMRLDDLASFVVERKKSGSDAWEPATTIDVVDQEKIRRRKSFAWRDTDAAAAGASYRVIAVTADGQQGPPNEAVDAPAGGDVGAGSGGAGGEDAGSSAAANDEASGDAAVGGDAGAVAADEAGAKSVDAASEGDAGAGSADAASGETHDSVPGEKPASDPVPILAR